MNKVLALMVGIPGSGKSTFAKHVQNYWLKRNHTCEIVSRDKIRFSLLAKIYFDLVTQSENYFSHEDEVWSNFVKEAVSSLEKNDITILDATHINAYSRKKIIKAIKQRYQGQPFDTIAIVMDESLITCLDRNSQREGLSIVPEKAIINMDENMTVPSKEENFNCVYLVNWDIESSNYYIFKEEEYLNE